MRLACVQSNVIFGDPAANALKAVETLRSLKAGNVEMAVFPEAYLTGYCVESIEQARQIAIPRDHSSLSQMEAAAADLDIVVTVGFAESVGDSVSNTAALFEPGQPPRFYQKTHLPELGLDKFVQPGGEIGVFDTRYGRIGILVCFDLRPPEPTRALALEGADLILLPTNWPQGAEIAAEHMAICRAAENGVFVATCDRVGTENGFTFIGLSKIISPKGQVLAAAGRDEETIVADLDLAQARVKRNVIVPGKFETTYFESRRPELYGALVKP